MNKDKFKTCLINCGMKMNLHGFSYIIDLMCLINNDYPNLEKWKFYYHKVGQKYNVSEACVEKSIRHALESMRNNLRYYDTIDKYFGYDNCENSTSLLKFYNVLKEDGILLVRLNSVKTSECIKLKENGVEEIEHNLYFNKGMLKRFFS